MKSSHNTFQQGDIDSFNQIFHTYYVNLCRFAYSFVQDYTISEEIVQEIFITLWEKKSSIEIKTSIRSFLYTSVRNRSLNYLRDFKTRSAHENAFAIEQEGKFSVLENSWEQEVVENNIKHAVSQLPEKCRLIYEMSRNQNLSHQQIADQLQISPKTVENQMSIAIKKLKEKLAPLINFIFIW